jgi:hypothetical protein
LQGLLDLSGNGNGALGGVEDVAFLNGLNARHRENKNLYRLLHIANKFKQLKGSRHFTLAQINEIDRTQNAIGGY